MTLYNCIYDCIYITVYTTAYIYIYIYIYVNTSNRFLQQDPESLYCFGKIQGTAVCPIVFNT